MGVAGNEAMISRLGRNGVTTKPGLRTGLWTGLDYGFAHGLHRTVIEHISLQIQNDESTAVQPMFHFHNVNCI